MKVAMVDASLFTGRYDDSLCAALAAAGHDVSLLGRPFRPTDAITPRGYAYVPHFFGLSERLRRRMGEGGAFRAAKASEYMAAAALGPIGALAQGDIAHIQWLPFAAADRQLLRRLRKGPAALVHTVHNATPYHGDGRSTSIQGMGYGALLQAFDALIVHGAQTSEALLRQGVKADRIHVVPHPPMRLAQADAAALAEVPDPRRIRLLFFGTIRPYKGLDLLIDACLALWRSGLDFEVAVAGKPFVDISGLLASVREAGFGDRLIADLGFLTEERLDAHLRKADILVFPYRHIDSSGAFLSALHYGKAMVASDTGMFPMLPPGYDKKPAVTMAKAGNVPALERALRPLIESADVRAEAGQRAIDLCERLGSWEETARRTTQVYQEAMLLRRRR